MLHSPDSEIESLQLPAQIPPPEMLRPFSENQGAYRPWFWESEYKLNRYLVHLSDSELEQRYDSIAQCLQRLARGLYENWPRCDVRSDWYWYRKEHQTRYEMHRRGMHPPSLPILSRHVPGLYPPKVGGDTKRLYKFTNYADDFLRGKVRVGLEKGFLDGSLSPAQQDDEQTKTKFIPGERLTASDATGKRIPVLGSLAVEHSGSRYHLLSTADDWDPMLFNDFECTQCVVIHNVDAFTERLMLAGEKALPGTDFHHNPVDYFDPYESHLGQHVDHAMHKDFKYACQREYRFMWCWGAEQNPTGALFLELGPLNDIAEIVSCPASEPCSP